MKLSSFQLPVTAQSRNTALWITNLRLKQN